MKKYILTSFLFFSVFAIHAQNLLMQVKPQDSDLWGYANEKGDIVIPAQYKKCFPFTRTGLAPIYDANVKSFYFINVKGEKVQTELSNIELKEVLFELENFSNGLIIVKQNKKFGYMDKNGKIIIPIKYDKATSFFDDYASVSRDNKYYIIDKTGKEVVLTFDVKELREFHQGLAPFVDVSGSIGYIDYTGKIVVSAKYKTVGYLVGGMAWVKTSDELVGFINAKGDEVIKPQYNAAKNFNEEGTIARVKVGENWFYINNKGEYLNFKDIKPIADFCNGLARVENNEKFGFINLKGEWVVQAKYDAVRDFCNGYACVKTGNLWGLINTNGIEVVKPQYNGIKDIQFSK